MTDGWTPIHGYTMWNDPTNAMVTVENAGMGYKTAGLAMFRDFRETVSATDGWTEVFQNPTVKVSVKPAAVGQPGEGLNMFKVDCTFPECRPNQLYDSLHDPDFRKTWDSRMIAGYNICKLDERNDIGYYAAKMPFPLANRDFLNQRMWMEFTNGEYIIMNHTVTHPACPEDKKYVRGTSYNTGFYISPLGPQGGTRLQYISHNDPKGAIPHFVLNASFSKMIPAMMATLEKNCLTYVAWSAKTHPAGFVAPWSSSKVAWEEEEITPTPSPGPSTCCPSPRLAEPCTTTSTPFSPFLDTTTDMSDADKPATAEKLAVKNQGQRRSLTVRRSLGEVKVMEVSVRADTSSADLHEVFATRRRSQVLEAEKEALKQRNPEEGTPSTVTTTPVVESLAGAFCFSVARDVTDFATAHVGQGPRMGGKGKGLLGAASAFAVVSVLSGASFGGWSDVSAATTAPLMPPTAVRRRSSAVQGLPAATNATLAVPSYFAADHNNKQQAVLEAGPAIVVGDVDEMAGLAKMDAPGWTCLTCQAKQYFAL